MTGARAQKLRRIRARWVIAVIVGAAVGTLIGIPLGLAAGIIAGWAGLGLSYVLLTLRVIWPMSGAETREYATIEDPGRGAERLIATVGSLTSLAAVVVVMVQARSESGVTAYLLGAIALLSVVSSWLLIQTDYVVRYAREYYVRGDDGDPLRGIDFNQSDDPEYTDFAYFTVSLGLTYQVSDNNISRNPIRRIVIGQSLLAYVFIAGILATVVNLVAGLS